MKPLRPTTGLTAILVATGLAAGLAVGLAGCSAIDPYERPGTWRPSEANALNLELQIARPTDLVQGRGTDTADGDTAVLAVDRLRHDKTRALVSAPTSSAGGGAAPAAGGQ